MKPNTFLQTTMQAAQKVSHLRVARFFRYSDLRCGHEGLIDYAKEKGFDYNELKPGEFLVFVNSQENRLKVLTVNGLLVYLRHPSERKFDLSIIRYLPKFFNGTSLDYKNALTEMVMEKANKFGARRSLSVETGNRNVPLLLEQKK